MWSTSCYLTLSLWYAVQHQRWVCDGGRLISFPSVPLESTSVWSHRAGLDPLTTQSEGRAGEFPLPPPHLLLSPHSHSLHPSLLRGNNRKHVSSDTCTYSVPTDTHRLSGRLCAPLTAKTNCCDYIFNILPFSQNPHPYITYLCYSGGLTGLYFLLNSCM